MWKALKIAVLGFLGLLAVGLAAKHRTREADHAERAKIDEVKNHLGAVRKDRQRMHKAKAKAVAHEERAKKILQQAGSRDETGTVTEFLKRWNG